jgi:hypothetical protein
LAGIFMQGESKEKGERLWGADNKKAPLEVLF